MSTVITNVTDLLYRKNTDTYLKLDTKIADLSLSIKNLELDKLVLDRELLIAESEMSQLELKIIKELRAVKVVS